MIKTNYYLLKRLQTMQVWPEPIGLANELGLKNIVCSGGLMGKTEDGVKKKCDQMNHVDEMAKKGGMIAGYHNHNKKHVVRKPLVKKIMIRWGRLFGIIK